jgi:hypothetical protein
MTAGNDMHDDVHRSRQLPERLLELLADRAVFGLDDAERRELEGLLRDHPAAEGAGLELIAAAVAVATAPGAAGDPPPGLEARLRDDARRFRSRPTPPVLARGIAMTAMAALATAAGLLLMVGRPGDESTPPVAVPPLGDMATDVDRTVPVRAGSTPAVQREELLENVQDVVRLDCAAGAGEQDDPRALGDVVWSPSRQRGFLRIRGLTKNDPARSRYQIWIIDGSRGTPLPGGLFDIASENGEVVVPILPRGFVQAPTMLAITVEEPGGADGSGFDRGRVVARAD